MSSLASSPVTCSAAPSRGTTRSPASSSCGWSFSAPPSACGRPATSSSTSFPPGLRRATELLGVLAIILFGAVLVQQGWKLVELGQFQQTPVMGLSKRYVYASMPVGGILIILYSLPHLWRALSGRTASNLRH